MVSALSLYVDDSGSRVPDRQTGHTSSPWFGLGGILLWERDEGDARTQYLQFRDTWKDHFPDTTPLHSYDIRQKKGPFAWLKANAETSARFYSGLTDLIVASPIHATACVIDRAGYVARYFHKYEQDKRWLLCKTAFSVLLERTVKYAARVGAVVRVYVERSDKKTDRQMLEYYNELRSIGMPFDPGSSAAYRPLDAATFKRTLYDFKTKEKSSPLMQLADLCLYPVCSNPYNTGSRAYQALQQGGKLIEALLTVDERHTCGIKYSCFDARKTTPVD